MHVKQNNEYETEREVSQLTGLITSIDAIDCESTNLPPTRFGTL